MFIYVYICFPIQLLSNLQNKLNVKTNEIKIHGNNSPERMPAVKQRVLNPEKLSQANVGSSPETKIAA